MSTVIREISEADLPEAIRVLCEGFPHRSPAYWQSGLNQLARLDAPAHTVRFGHAMFVKRTMRGVILCIPSVHKYGAVAQTFVNLSSWCVDPSHRGRSALQLYAQASSGHVDLTYTNLSATAHTLKAVVARGFQQWTAGQMLCVGIRSSPGRKRFVPSDQARSAGLAEPVARILADHAKFGCFAFCLETSTKLIPLIFLRRRVKSIPVAQLIYCESLDELISNGLAVSAWFAARGYPAMLVDTNGPVAGLLGKYFPGRAGKFFKGPAPRLDVEHTYTEMVYFGF